jgi:IS30 family transposase
MRTYSQLTYEQRYQIYALLTMKHSMTEIAEVVGVHKSTVSRELRRNRGKRRYRPQQAHRFSMARRCNTRHRIIPETWALIDTLIRCDWSPQQISGRLKIEHGIQISHERIYQYILEDKRSGGDLYRHLRCHKKRRKRYGSCDRRGKIPNKIGIEERPAVINDRLRIGDWEVDTLIGKGRKNALVTLTERRSRMALVGKVTRRSARSVTDTIVALLSPFADRAHSLTSDNGTEFARHQEIARRLNLNFYFAHPYSAWERGTNENMNGLVRQYFPKHRDLTTVTDSEIHHAMQRLNSRPRKCLAFRTPLEVFFNQPVALES